MFSPSVSFTITLLFISTLFFSNANALIIASPQKTKFISISAPEFQNQHPQIPMMNNFFKKAVKDAEPSSIIQTSLLGYMGCVFGDTLCQT